MQKSVPVQKSVPGRQSIPEQKSIPVRESVPVQESMAVAPAETVLVGVAVNTPTVAGLIVGFLKMCGRVTCAG
jgi:hypothetical protein